MVAYGEHERERWLELAEELGPQGATLELGYPAKRTAARWLAEHGLDVTKSEQHVRARAMRQAYSDAEQTALASQVLDAIADRLERTLWVFPPGMGPQEQPLAGAELNQLAAAVQKAVATIRLVQGRSTENLGLQAMDDLTAEARALYLRSREANERAVLELEEGDHEELTPA